MRYNYLFLPWIFTVAHSLNFYSSINDLTISIQLPAEFDCWISYDSPVIITWTHNTNIFTCGTQCVPNINGYSFGSGISPFATLYRMTIDSVELTDSGTVTCEATQISNGSSISITATLIVRDVADFIRIPIAQSRNLGGTVTFDCVVNKGGGTFVWKRGETDLDPNYERYTVASFAYNSSLLITNLTAIDIGEYTCEYSLFGEVINSSRGNLILTDYVPPYVLTGSIQQVNLVFGPTTVICPTGGNPIPTDITWYHNGNQVPTSSTQGPYSLAGILQFDSSTEYNAGEYTCIASNGFQIGNGTVIVTVIVLTRWYIIMGLCVAVISVVCVGSALVLSLICCCCDRRSEKKLQEKYRDRMKQMKSRRTQRVMAMKQQTERAKANQGISVGDKQQQQQQQARRFTQPPNLTNSERITNPDGSVTYSAKRDSVQVNVARAKRPNTVSEITAVITEKQPTHLQRPTK